MTNEEAIEMFSVAVTATLYEEEQDLYRTAIKALEKQIPKKPSPIRSLRSGREIGKRCPSANCKTQVVNGWKYCLYCGQALDWREENANNS